MTTMRNNMFLMSLRRGTNGLYVMIRRVPRDRLNDRHVPKYEVAAGFIPDSEYISYDDLKAKAEKVLARYETFEARTIAMSKQKEAGRNAAATRAIEARKRRLRYTTVGSIVCDLSINDGIAACADPKTAKALANMLNIAHNRLKLTVRRPCSPC